MVLYIPDELVDMFLDHYPLVNKIVKGKKEKVKVIRPFNFKDGKCKSVFTLTRAKWGDSKDYKTTIYEELNEIIVPFVSGHNYYNGQFLKKMKNKDLIIFIGTGTTHYKGVFHYTGKIYNVKLLRKAEEYSGNYFKFKINEKIQNYIYNPDDPYNRQGL